MKLKNTFFYALLVLILSAFVLTACGDAETDTDEAGGTDDSGQTDSTTEDDDDDDDDATSEGDAEDNTLIIGMGADIVTFDIHDHNNTSTEAVHVNMFNYLVRNVDGDIQPDLVESYENIDETTWAFTLKDGVEFHDGTPLTAEDVKFTLERVAADDSLREHNQYNQIADVNIIDDLNFEIITHGPEPAMLNRLSRLGSGIVPKHYVEEHGWDHFASNPIGTGPYEFVEWVRDDRVVMERFDNYFEGNVSDWDTVIFRSIPEASTRVAELLTGGIDIAVDIPPADWDRVEQNDGTYLSQGDSNRVMLFIIKAEDDMPTSDPRVREAIDYAIDNQTIVDTVLGGSGTPVRTRVTPGIIGANHDLYDTFRYDPDHARALLEEAGYADGEVEITINSPQGRYLMDSEVVEVVAGMLSQVGIQANIEFLEWSAFTERRNAGENDEMMYIGFGNSLGDGYLALHNFKSDRIPEQLAYSNAEVDELVDLSETNMDLEERIQQFERIQEIVAEELPYIYIAQLKTNTGLNDRIEFDLPLNEMIYARDIKKVN